MIFPEFLSDIVSRNFVPAVWTTPRRSDLENVRRVKALARSLHARSDSELIERRRTLAERLQAKQIERAEQDVVVNGFALVHESIRRCLAIELYEVQLLAALSMVRGSIAELATGEGKTLVQAVAGFLFALEGDGVHVMTSNAYLAERDYTTLSPVLQRLGLSVGLLGQNPAEKARAYQADVTFGAGYEFGFDYLRDQVSAEAGARVELGESIRRQLRGDAATVANQLQRGLAVAIIDEADSVLIDEANTPLLLASGLASDASNSRVFCEAARVAKQLNHDVDYHVSKQRSQVELTAAGRAAVMSRQPPLAIGQLERPWPVYLEQALTAELCFERDVNYIVESDRIVLVDQATGRIFPDRTLRRGMQQAIEAKEGLPITAAPRSRAQISRQKLFTSYGVLCGMTGTAWDARREFREFYDLKVELIPTRKPSKRQTLPTRFFSNAPAKHSAIVDEVVRRHATRQPILIGARSIGESRQFAHELSARGLDFQLLNGTQDREEAEVIEATGQAGAITIATNIAGRGADIGLGEGVAELGGLHVISAAPSFSRRVDRQLLGRAARQGDPGSCQQFVSADDELIRHFGSRLARTMRRLADPQGEVHADLSAALSRLQRHAAQAEFDRRRQMIRDDNWMDECKERLSGRSS